MRRIVFASLAIALSAGCAGGASELQVEDGPLVFVPMGNSALFRAGAERA